MPYSYNQDKAQVFGFTSNKVSRFVKTIITQGSVSVIGLTGEDSNNNYTANWASPLEDESVGNNYSRIGAIAQSRTGLTTKTIQNFVQVWNGNIVTFSLTLNFAVSENASFEQGLNEVDRAVQWLKIMQSANLSKNFIGVGRIPNEVDVLINGTTMFKGLVIEEMGVPAGNPKASNGMNLHSSITLSLQSKYPIDRGVIARSVKY